ncbi:hypothetical protein NRK67_13200 [Fusobacteria bacterium ZRK30]|nr:hypothetical protein NRK67_13200 [Fusobacteria bacterium ZRK30]
MIFIALTFLILFLLILLYICNFIKTMIVKEIILYPAFIFCIEIAMIFSIGTFFYEFYESNFNTIFIGASLLGMVLYGFTMKKIDNTISKIDIYIYIYTLLQVYAFILIGWVKQYIVLCILLYIAFYFINIYCFYRFKKEKLLKIIIMPSLVSVLILFTFGLVMMVGLAGSV